MVESKSAEATVEDDVSITNANPEVTSDQDSSFHLPIMPIIMLA